MREAICRAATRLGSNTTILPVPSRCPSRMVNGSTVDFPAPGAAVTIAAVSFRRVSFSGFTNAATGRVSNSLCSRSVIPSS